MQCITYFALGIFVQKKIIFSFAVSSYVVAGFSAMSMLVFQNSLVRDRVRLYL